MPLNDANHTIGVRIEGIAVQEGHADAALWSYRTLEPGSHIYPGLAQIPKSIETRVDPRTSDYQLSDYQPVLNGGARDSTGPDPLELLATGDADQIATVDTHDRANDEIQLDASDLDGTIVYVSGRTMKLTLVTGQTYSYTYVHRGPSTEIFSSVFEDGEPLIPAGTPVFDSPSFLRGRLLELVTISEGVETQLWTGWIDDAGRPDHGSTLRLQTKSYYDFVLNDLPLGPSDSLDRQRFGISGWRLRRRDGHTELVTDGSLKNYSSDLTHLTDPTFFRAGQAIIKHPPDSGYSRSYRPRLGTSFDVDLSDSDSVPFGDRQIREIYVRQDIDPADIVLQLMTGTYEPFGIMPRHWTPRVGVDPTFTSLTVDAYVLGYDGEGSVQEDIIQRVMRPYGLYFDPIGHRVIAATRHTIRDLTGADAVEVYPDTLDVEEQLRRTVRETKITLGSDIWGPDPVTNRYRVEGLGGPDQRSVQLSDEASYDLPDVHPGRFDEIRPYIQGQVLKSAEPPDQLVFETGHRQKIGDWIKIEEIPVDPSPITVDGTRYDPSSDDPLIGRVVGTHYHTETDHWTVRAELQPEPPVRLRAPSGWVTSVDGSSTPVVLTMDGRLFGDVNEDIQSGVTVAYYDTSLSRLGSTGVTQSVTSLTTSPAEMEVDSAPPDSSTPFVVRLGDLESEYDSWSGAPDHGERRWVYIGEPDGTLAPSDTSADIYGL